MKLVLDYKLLIPKARPFIPNDLGYPGYVVVDNPLGTLSVHGCTLHLVHASMVKMGKTNSHLLIYYEVGISNSYAIITP